MKLNRLITRSLVATLGLVTVGVLSAPNAVKTVTVQAASNIYQMPDYSARSNAVVNTRGVKGIENGKYLQGNATPKSYKVTAGTQAGSQWHTAFICTITIS
ncbi:hypothetical protein [Lacticaseibacillus saniviri]|uniref:hypothetical protein n=1 Tax=Lacticaseibacillus saniviri TaxID=931533 RepID=UPI0006D0929D|nr:hypothetical protein [Lacticaseibacillus saniviri]